MNKYITVIALTVIILTACSTEIFAQDTMTFKVFILAGQSNMEGKASNELFEQQATDPKTRDLFAHLRSDDDWIVRDDVFIKFLDRSGPLTIGYGAVNKTGVELEFGNVMGDHFEEPVLLIKTAWGGHSLYQKFRSPSAGLPADEALQSELKHARQRVTRINANKGKDDPLPTMEDIEAVYGSSYRAMIDEVNHTLENCETLFPALESRQPELTGFVWFQGFNDMFGPDAPNEYMTNMKLFIEDVRKDLNAPDTLFVIGALGQNGSSPASDKMQMIQTAQLAMNDVPEFEGNVKTIRTDVLVDKDAEELFPEWKERREEWYKTGSDRPYHYLGSAIWFNRIGKSMGDTMLELLQNSTSQQ